MSRIGTRAYLIDDEDNENCEIFMFKASQDCRNGYWAYILRYDIKLLSLRHELIALWECKPLSNARIGFDNKNMVLPTVMWKLLILGLCKIRCGKRSCTIHNAYKKRFIICCESTKMATEYNVKTRIAAFITAIHEPLWGNALKLVWLIICIKLSARFVKASYVG